MTWDQLCTMERRPSLLMDGRQSSIIKATRFSTNLTTNHWQLTTNKRQTTNNKRKPATDNQQQTTDNQQQVKEWQGSPDGPKESFDRQVLGKYFFFKQHFFKLMAGNIYVPTISSDIEKLRLLYQCPTTSLQKCNTGAICSVPPMVLLLLLLLVVYNRTFSFIRKV